VGRFFVFFPNGRYLPLTDDAAQQKAPMTAIYGEYSSALKDNKFVSGGGKKGGDLRSGGPSSPPSQPRSHLRGLRAQTAENLNGS